MNIDRQIQFGRKFQLCLQGASLDFGSILGVMIIQTDFADCYDSVGQCSLFHCLHLAFPVFFYGTRIEACHILEHIREPFPEIEHALSLGTVHVRLENQSYAGFKCPCDDLLLLPVEGLIVYVCVRVYVFYHHCPHHQTLQR